MLRFAKPNAFHEIDVEGTKVRVRSMSLGERMEILRGTEKLIEVKDGKLVNAGLFAQLIESIDGRTDVEVAINELETADDLLKLVRAIVNFSTLGETASKNSENSLSGKPPEATPTGSSPTLSEEVVAADLNALAKKE